MWSRKGFSLVELLVIISIIAVLSAILLPVYSTVRKRGQEQVYISNLRQIGMALNIYTLDYDDHYPYSVGPFLRVNPGPVMVNYNMTEAQVKSIPTSIEALTPYVKTKAIFSCPLDLGSNEFSQALQSEIHPSYFSVFGSSYGFESLLRKESPSCIREPSTFVYSSDATGEWHSAPNTFIGSRRVGQLFYDGHVVVGIPAPLSSDYSLGPCGTSLRK